MITVLLLTAALSASLAQQSADTSNAYADDARAIALGKKLFFDKRLSSTQEVACGSCHLQEHAFADPRPLSIGVHGRTGTRNAPMLVNH